MLILGGTSDTLVSSIIEEGLDPEQPTTTFQGLSDRYMSGVRQNGLFTDKYGSSIKKVNSPFTTYYDLCTRPSLDKDAPNQLAFTGHHKETKMLDPDLMHKNTTKLSHVIERQKEASALLRATIAVSKQELLLSNRLANVFYNARDEVFESGMSSRFSKELHRIILEYGVVAIEQLCDMILSGNASMDVADEALRQLGCIDDAKTHDARLLLLEIALKSDNLSIRNAAAVGMDYLEDPKVIPSLKRAAQREQPGWFRQYLNDVIAQLKKDNNEVSEIR